jgi:hypothetical protein
MSNFMQEHLLNFVWGAVRAQISRERNAMPPVVALAKPGFGVVKAKGPCHIEMVENKEFVGSVFYPGERCHGARISGRVLGSLLLHTALEKYHRNPGE